MFFRANDGTSGAELWKSDGSAAGTTRVRDINTGVGDSNLGSLTNVNGRLFFDANDGTHGRELWEAHINAAQALDIKESTARMLYGRALARLEELLAPEDGPTEAPP